MKAISIEAGLSESALRDILRRGTTPSIEAFVAIARAIGTSPAELLLGEQAMAVELPRIGAIDGRDAWSPVGDGIIDRVRVDAGRDMVTVHVETNAMAPAYRIGDLLICQRQSGAHLDNMIGTDCVMQLADGRCLVKVLRRGRAPGLYTLRSFDATTDDVEDVALDWAARVVVIRRDS